MTAAATVEQVIAAASSVAAASADRAANFAQAATAIFLAGVPPDIANPDKPTQIIDPSNLPDLNALLDQDLTPLFTSTYDTKYRDLIEKLKAEFLEYINTHFPDLDAELASLSDNLMGVVNGNNSLMLSPATEQALLDRHADRADKQLLRTEEEINTYWSGRGFLIPQGIQDQQLVESRTEVQLGIISQSREIAVEQMKLEIENIKFGLTTLLTQKMQAIAAAAQYISVLGRTATDAAQYTAQLMDSKRLYADLATKYYDVYVTLAQLLLRYDEIRINKDLQIFKVGVDADQALVSTKVGAAIAAAGAMGDIAAAAYGSQNSIATIAHETQATE